MDKENSVIEEIKSYLYNDNIDRYNENIIIFFRNKIKKILDTEAKKKELFKNEDDLNEITKKIIKIIHIFSKSPFTTQEEISFKLKIERKKLISINALIRKLKIAQDIITNFGIAKKHWNNTIIPVSKSGSLMNYKKNKYQFPFRVILFPGLSCMFECTFCGRNYQASYKRSSLDEGMKAFFRLIDESPSPKNDENRFYISGGLEPLTNPKIGSLISYLKDKGFNSSMYTNAYMLTSKYLFKNSEIFNLTSLRVSAYGVDEKKTFEVTKRKNAFDIVKKNIKEYLIAKNQKKNQTRFGLNFVILKNQSEDVINMLKMISSINKSIDNKNKKNNFDFLTLREDFRLFGERINNLDRKNLLETFNTVDLMLKNDPYLENLFIDYGFALDPIRKGYLGERFQNIIINLKELEEFKLVGTPQISVVVDLYGDVYLWREAGFLDRPGAKRYIAGNLIKDGSMENIISKFIKNRPEIIIKDSDRDYLDAWDHVVAKLVVQNQKDDTFGIPFEDGPINDRIYQDAQESLMTNKYVESYPSNR